ncbi:MAG: hypothetical protein AAFO79_02965 [Pseudomonadota bacterium]
MRASDRSRGSLLSYIDREERLPAVHPLHTIRTTTNHALAVT